MTEIPPFEPKRGYSPDHPYTTEEGVLHDSITPERMQRLREIAERIHNTQTIQQEVETPLE